MKLNYLLLSFLFLSLFILPEMDAGTTAYRIRVASLKKAPDMERLNFLYQLGMVDIEPSDNGNRIYLGNYLDKRTADIVLSKVKKKGFKDAYIVSDTFAVEYEPGKFYTHTYQVGAFKKLDVSAFNVVYPELKGKVYVRYSGGVYRISLGLYSDERLELKDYFQSLSNRMEGGGFGAKI